MRNIGTGHYPRGRNWFGGQDGLLVQQGGHFPSWLLLKCLRQCHGSKTWPCSRPHAKCTRKIVGSGQHLPSPWKRLLEQHHCEHKGAWKSMDLGRKADSPPPFSPPPIKWAVLKLLCKPGWRTPSCLQFNTCTLCWLK